MSNKIHNKRRLPLFLSKVEDYFAECFDEASHDFELFCRRIGFKTQQRDISLVNQMTEGERDGRHVEIKTNEHFMNCETQNDTLPTPINQTSTINNILRAGKNQDVVNSQYQNSFGLTPPDEIDMFFSDTQANESIPENSIFYNKTPTRNTPDSNKWSSFFKNKYLSRIATTSNIPKQILSPIRKQKTLSVAASARNSTANTTTTNCSNTNSRSGVASSSNAIHTTIASNISNVNTTEISPRSMIQHRMPTFSYNKHPYHSLYHYSHLQKKHSKMPRKLLHMHSVSKNAGCDVDSKEIGSIKPTHQH